LGNPAKERRERGKRINGQKKDAVILAEKAKKQESDQYKKKKKVVPEKQKKMESPRANLKGKENELRKKGKGAVPWHLTEPKDRGKSSRGGGTTGE